MTVDLDGDSVELAPRLLGSVLHGPNGSGRIVEVEAYRQDDSASHSFAGPTARNEVMFGPCGRLYVYLIYGMHHCANVVTGPVGDGQAVLIRALEPVVVTPAMRTARPKARRDIDLTNGPGKLCQALGIDRKHNGADLFDAGAVHLERQAPAPASSIVADVRIGISKAIDRPWRWYLDANPYVSKLAR